MQTFDDVSAIAAGLPGSEEKVSGGGMAWFVRRKPYAWESRPWPSEVEHIRELVRAEPCIGVKLPDDDTRRALVQGWPDTFVASEVSWGGSKILIRMNAIDAQHLLELVTDAWRTEAPKYLVREFDGDVG